MAVSNGLTTLSFILLNDKKFDKMISLFIIKLSFMHPDSEGELFTAFRYCVVPLRFFYSYRFLALSS